MADGHHSLLPRSQELLLQAALGNGEMAVKAWRGWKAVGSVTSTDHHSGRLLPLLYRKLLALGVDDPDLPFLKQTYRRQWLANQYRILAAGRALDALSRAGIETMVLKGAALAQRHYEDLGVRPMFDVDVLVRPERACQAAAALVESGWTQSAPTRLEVLLPVTHGTAFRANAVDGIDLHWGGMWAPAVDDDFWEAAEPIEIGGASTLAQCPADQLLHACVHGLWSGDPLPRWVADAVAVIRSTPGLDWDRVVDRARARTVTLPVQKALTYLRDRFEMPVPPYVLEALKRTRRGALESATDRMWRTRLWRLQITWLALEYYRRQRALPPGPSRAPNLQHYVRCWLAMNFDRPGPTSSSPCSRFPPGDIAPAGRPRPR